MKKHLFDYAFSSLVIASLIYVVYLGCPSPDVHFLKHSADFFDWHLRTNAIHNAHFFWKADAFWLKYWPGIQVWTPTFVEILYVTVFSALAAITGVIALSRSLGGKKLHGFICGSLGVLSILCLFGSDVTILPVVCWLPWGVYFSLQVLSASFKLSILSSVALYLVSLRLAEASSGLVLLVLVAQLGITFSLYMQTDRRIGFKGVRCLLLMLCLLVPLISSFIEVPVAKLPAYPHLARVVPDDGIAGEVLPLYGPSYGTAVIDRQALKSIYEPITLSALTLATVFFLLSMSLPLGRVRPLFFAALFCLFASLADAMFKESISHIMPAFSLTRVLPKVMAHAVAPVMLGIFLLIFSVAVSVLGAHRNFSVALCVMLLMLGVGGESSSRFPLRAGVSISEKNISFISDAKAFALNDELKRVINSPSLYLFKTQGLWLASSQEKINNLVFTPLMQLGEVIDAFPKQSENELSLAADGNLRTFWTSRSGGQKGKEWLLIKLEKETSIQGIELQAGRSYTDFPRGFRISFGDECDIGKKNSFKLVYEAGDWPGVVRYTSDGFPYYSDQSLVQVSFDTSEKTSCILIEQTKDNVSFDWTVAEIGLSVSN